MSAVRVYMVNTLDKSFADNREYLARSFSAFRTEKLEKIAASGSGNVVRKGATEYDRCLAAGLVTDIALQSYGLREKDMKYGFTGRGKPVFLNHPDLMFNISHAGHFAVAAISEEYDPGIDIECCSRISNRIIYHFFSEGEREMILSQPDEQTRQLMFGRIWTVREAFMKSTGLGLSTPRDGYEVIMKEGRLAISQHCFERDFGTFELKPVEDYCISIVAGCKVNTVGQANA